MTLILRKLLASSTYAISDTLQGLANKLQAASDASNQVQVTTDQLADNFELLPEIEDEWAEDDEGTEDTQGPAAAQFSPQQLQEMKQEMETLNMMYPRLYLARNLLRDDGSIFLTIDDGEVSNLRVVMDQVFGEENFVAAITWQKKQSPQRDATYFSDMHDYVLVYAKNTKTSKQDDLGWKINLLARGAAQEARYKNPDNDERGPWASVDCTINKTADERPNLYYPIKNPHTGADVLPSKQRTWAFEPESMAEIMANKRIW